MFIGHIGTALAAKKLAPNASLGTLILAAELPDLILPIFLLAGWETVGLDLSKASIMPLAFPDYPWSHSLLMNLLAGLLLGGIYYLIKKKLKTALILSGLVVFHWILDFISHLPDMPLSPGLEITVGLGLWRSVLLTVIFEGGIFIAGLMLYVSAVPVREKKKKIAFWVMICLIIGIYLSSLFGPPPPKENLIMSVAMVNLSAWLLVFWAAWADKRIQI